jgi:photosystem II stability/assembly factor-like uncharacterized protein
MYLVASGGGVWKTTNAGAHWTPLTDGQPTLIMGAIAIARSNPNVIYAGTGESTGYNSPPFAFFLFGRGVLKSSDGGNTWTLLGSAHFDRHTVTRIVVHPSDPNTVYVAVAPGECNGLTGSAGIWKSIDGGTNWLNTTATISTTDAFSDLAMDPSNAQVLYAAVGSSMGAAANGIYKTVNGGASWSPAGTLPAGPVLGTIKLAVAPSSTRTIYASIIASAVLTNYANFKNFPVTSGLYEMIKSVDGGSSWSVLSGTPNYLMGGGFFCSTLSVHPTNPDIIYAGGCAPENTGQPGLIQSLDGGLTWYDLGTGIDGYGVHGDSHAMAFDAAGRLLFGDDGGIWRLEDPIDTLWSDLNSDLNTIQFVGIALHPRDPAIVYGGCQDNGTVKCSGGRQEWIQICHGDGGHVRIDPTHPATVYHELCLSI